MNFNISKMVYFLVPQMNRRAFCMRMRQYGLKNFHGGIFCVLFTFTSSIWNIFSGAECILVATFDKGVP